MKFSGFYFDKKLSDKKLSAEIEFAGAQIKIKPESSETIFWDQTKTDMFCGGSNNHLYFFNLAGKPEVSFYLNRSKELDEFFSNLPNPKFKECITKRKNSSRTLMMGSFSIIALIGLLVFSFWSFREHAFDALVDQIPFEKEKEIGKLLFDSVAPKDKRIGNEESQALLDSLTKELIKQVPAPYNELQIVVIRGKEKNAFAVPGGYIAFYTGAIESFSDYSEFSGVLAHELAHVYRRHGLRNIIKSTSLYLVVSSLLGDLSGLIAVVADQGAFLLSRGFSREYESEADKLAFKKLVDANIDPRGLSSFFGKLMENQKLKEAEEKLSFLSTHPPSKERVSFVENSYEKLDSTQKTKLRKEHSDFKKWKALLLKEKQ
jgi:Zn-dependent protease with chaperone function